MTHFLSDDDREVRELVRRVARERVMPRADEIDRTAEYPQDMFDLLKELGLFTLPFPEAYGGRDSLFASCLAVEELNRVCYNTGYLLVVQWTPFGAIMAAGTERQQQKYLPGLANGDLRAVSLPLEKHIRIIRRAGDMDEGDKYYHRRPVLEMTLCIGGQRHKTEVNLADRRQFSKAMLIGARPISAFNAMVDPSAEYLQDKNACGKGAKDNNKESGE